MRAGGTNWGWFKEAFYGEDEGLTADAVADRAHASVQTRRGFSLDSPTTPHWFPNFVGQDRVRRSLETAIAAAHSAGEVLSHVLLVGSRGLGKATFAQIIARSMDVNIKNTVGPAIRKPDELAALLTGLNKRDVFVHRRDPPPEKWRRRISPACRKRFYT